MSPATRLPTLLVATFAACSPAEPDTASGGSARSNSDTAGGTDTADDIGSADRCAVEEVEDADFANDFGQQLEVPLDTWACGYVDAAGDNDYLTFTTTSSGWVEILVEAEVRGSPADMWELVNYVEGGQGTKSIGPPGSLDPWNVFYAEQRGTYIVDLLEETEAFGPDYGWWFKAAMTTAPVAYDVMDAGDHSSLETAEALPTETTYFASIGTPGESDWWHVEVPEGARQMTVDVDAVPYGSSADMTLDLYWSDPDSTYMFTDDKDQDRVGEDPWCQPDLDAVEQARDMTGIDIRAYNWEEYEGSIFHWYTITVSFD